MSQTFDTQINVLKEKAEIIDNAIDRNRADHTAVLNKLQALENIYEDLAASKAEYHKAISLLQGAFDKDE